MKVTRIICPAIVESLEDRRLLSFSPAVVYPVGLTPKSMAASDFNNDGRTDLVAANSSDGSVSVLLGNGDGAFQSARTSATGVRPQMVLTGELDGDGRTDVVTINLWDDYAFGGDISVLPGNGDGHFQVPRTVPLPVQMPPGYAGPPLSQTPRCAALCDLNADGRLDLIAGGSTWYQVLVGYDSDTQSPIYEGRPDGYLNVLLGRGDGTFAPGIAYHTASESNNIAVADFDGNGKLDVVTDIIGLSTFPGNGDGTFAAPRRSAASGGAVGGGSMPVADFNLDGRPDLLMRDGSGNFVFAMLNNGDGTFRETEHLLLWTFLRAALGDVNADGKPDALVFNYGIPDDEGIGGSVAHVLLGRGDGTFAAPVNADIIGHLLTSPVLADFDRDGYLDAAGTDGGFIGVSRNAANWATKTFIGAGGAGSGGNWSAGANWSPSGVPAANDLVTISGKAVNLSSNAIVANLTLTGGATLTLAAEGNRVFGTSGLAIDATSKLNLSDNDLIVDYTGPTPLNGVVALLASGRGSVPGGIYSPQANASGASLALGIGEAKDVLGLVGSQTAVFSGQTVDASAVLVRFTAAGDADLDGNVGFADLARLAQNYNNSTAGAWAGGDFNYDGRIDFGDLSVLAQNYNRQEFPTTQASAADDAPAMLSSTEPRILTGRRRIDDRTCNRTFNHAAPVRKPIAVAKGRRAIR